jgi:hypothetical protein
MHERQKKHTLKSTLGSRIEAFMVIQIQGEDEGSIGLRNVGTLPHHYTVSQPREPQHEGYC